MPSQADKARTFLELHKPGDPLLLPNPWNQGSARLLESMGFAALASPIGKSKPGWSKRISSDSRSTW